MSDAMDDPELNGWHGSCSIGHWRVYIDGAQDVAHLLCEHSPNDARSSAICGKLAPAESPFWFGTGTQDELDRAKELDLCLACRKAAM